MRVAGDFPETAAHFTVIGAVDVDQRRGAEHLDRFFEHTVQLARHDVRQGAYANHRYIAVALARAQVRKQREGLRVVEPHADHDHVEVAAGECQLRLGQGVDEAQVAPRQAFGDGALRLGNVRYEDAAPGHTVPLQASYAPSLS